MSRHGSIWSRGAGWMPRYGKDNGEAAEKLPPSSLCCHPGADPWVSRIVGARPIDPSKRHIDRSTHCRRHNILHRRHSSIPLRSPRIRQGTATCPTTKTDEKSAETGILHKTCRGDRPRSPADTAFETQAERPSSRSALYILHTFCPDYQDKQCTTNKDLQQ